MNILQFKSNKCFYEKEKSGVKNNTVRNIEKFDDERLILLNFYLLGVITKMYIKIFLEDTDEFFIRSVRDVSYYNGCFIITWDL